MTSLVDTITSFFEYIDITLRIHWHSLIKSGKNSFVCLDSRKQFFLSSSHLENSASSSHFSFTFHLSFTSHRRYNLFSSHLENSVFHSHLIVATMMLALFFEDRTFDDLKDLLLYLNQHADSEDYAIILKRTKKSKLKIISKTWIICDRDRKYHHFTNQNRRHEDNKHIECLFSIVVKLDDENVDSWIFDIRNFEHNHAFSVVDVHSALRKMIMTSKIKSRIFRQLIVQIAFSKILFSLRLSHAESSNNRMINSHDDRMINLNDNRMINSNDNFLIRSRDVYNLKTELRKNELDSLSSMQALMNQLNTNDWFFAYQKNRRDQITHLFFFFIRSSQIILKNNFEVLVMNCTYKINKYKMSLFIVSDQIALHNIFYVIFCFMTKEKKNDYVWVLKQLKRLYQQLQLSDSTVLLTNMKKDNLNVWFNFFLKTNHWLKKILWMIVVWFFSSQIIHYVSDILTTTFWLIVKRNLSSKRQKRNSSVSEKRWFMLRSSSSIEISEISSWIVTIYLMMNALITCMRFTSEIIDVDS